MAKKKKTPKPPPVESSDFTPVIAAFDCGKDISVGRMFGSPGLKVGGKVFALFVKGQFVAKLPSSRVDALIASGTGKHFDPGHGRLMKEWVALSGEKKNWVKLAKEARDFVGGEKA